MKPVCAAFLALLALLGVASAAPSQASGVWLDVPFVRQTKDGCGAASLSMLLQYWSNHDAVVAPEKYDAAAIQQALYKPEARGIFASDMRRYLDEVGFRTFVFRGGWDDLRAHLARGRPLIACLKPGRRAPLHYLVVAGLDWKAGAVFVNDPARGKLRRIQRAEFEKQWQAAENWALLAVPHTAE